MDATTDITPTQSRWRRIARSTPFVATWLSAAMAAVGLLLTSLAVLALELSGGAARDTSLVVMVVAIAVTDFWAGGIMLRITGRGVRPLVAWWIAARSVWFVLLAILMPAFAVLVAIQIPLAAVAFVGGMRFARSLGDPEARTTP